MITRPSLLLLLATAVCYGQVINVAPSPLWVEDINNFLATVPGPMGNVTINLWKDGHYQGGCKGGITLPSNNEIAYITLTGPGAFIDCMGNGTVAQFLDIDNILDVVIEGVTITNTNVPTSSIPASDVVGSALTVNSALTSLTLINVIFYANSPVTPTTDSHVSIVAVTGGAYVVMTDTSFQYNYAPYGALVVSGNTNAPSSVVPTLTSCGFVSNYGYSQQSSAGLTLMSATLTCDTCLFTGNSAALGAGAYVDPESFGTFHASQFTSNTADLGGAVSCTGVCQSYDSLFDGNTASTCGGAWYAIGTGDIVSSNFTNNNAGVSGGAACLTGTTNYNVHTSRFESNGAGKKGFGGAFFLQSQSVILTTSTTYSFNDGGLSGGAFSTIGQSGVRFLDGNVMCDNTPNALDAQQDGGYEGITETDCCNTCPCHEYDNIACCLGNGEPCSPSGYTYYPSGDSGGHAAAPPPPKPQPDKARNIIIGIAIGCLLPVVAASVVFAIYQKNKMDREREGEAAPLVTDAGQPAVRDARFLINTPESDAGAAGKMII